VVEDAHSDEVQGAQLTLLREFRSTVETPEVNTPIDDTAAHRADADRCGAAVRHRDLRCSAAVRILSVGPLLIAYAI